MMKPKSKRTGRLTQASDVLQMLLQNGKSPLSDQFMRWQLWNHWRQIMTEDIANASTPVSYDRGILYIWVKSSAWLQELQFLSKTIKLKINQYFGENWVRQIRFTLDHKKVPRPGETAEDLRENLSKLLPNEGGDQ